MPRIVWTRTALSDLRRLHEFLQDVSPGAAQRAVATIRRGVAPLGEHPALGYTIEGAPAEFREWVIGFGANGYVVRYRPSPEAVVIIALRHGREAGY